MAGCDAWGSEETRWKLSLWDERDKYAGVSLAIRWSILSMAVPRHWLEVAERGRVPDWVIAISRVTARLTEASKLIEATVKNEICW